MYFFLHFCAMKYPFGWVQTEEPAGWTAAWTCVYLPWRLWGSWLRWALFLAVPSRLRMKAEAAAWYWALWWTWEPEKRKRKGRGVGGGVTPAAVLHRCNTALSLSCEHFLHHRGNSRRSSLPFGDSEEWWSSSSDCICSFVFLTTTNCCRIL